MLDESGLILLTEALGAWDRAQQAREILARAGLIQQDRKTGRTVAHPAVVIERDARLQFARLWRALRLDEDSPGPLGGHQGGDGMTQRRRPRRRGVFRAEDLNVEQTLTLAAARTWNRCVSFGP